MALPLRSRRKSLGLTVEQAAAAAGITVSAWYKIETGARKPSYESLRAIAAALQWTPADLFQALACTESANQQAAAIEPAAMNQ